jgi:hypothetical protein
MTRAARSDGGQIDDRSAMMGRQTKQHLRVFLPRIITNPSTVVCVHASVPHRQPSFTFHPGLGEISNDASSSKPITFVLL